MFVSAMLFGAMPKSASVGEPVAHASVTPVGVTDTVTGVDACAESFVVTVKVAVRAVPAVAVDGTVAQYGSALSARRRRGGQA